MNYTDIENQNIELKFNATPQITKEIRAFIFQLAKNISGMSQKDSYRLQSIIDELTNNAIEHGSSLGDPIKIIIDKNANRILFSISDLGTGPSKVDAQELKRKIEEKKNNFDPTNYKSMRGRGLPLIVASWSDNFNIKNNESGGLTFEIEKNI